MYSKKELRIKNGDIPNFPELSESDLKPDLLQGVRKPFWTFEEASFYLKGYAPNQKLSSNKRTEVDQTLFWLNKSEMEYKHGRKASPGDYFRYLCSENYPFDSKMWLLYEISLRGDIKDYIAPHIAVKRYKMAIQIIDRELKEVTVGDMADFLVVVSEEIKDENGLRLLPKRARSTIKDYVKIHKRPLTVNKGRPKPGTTKNPFNYKDHLYDLIEKEMGYFNRV